MDRRGARERVSRRRTAGDAGRGSAAAGARPRAGLEVRPSRIHGRGVFATRRLRRGTRLLEYTGERITPEEADRRYDDDALEHAHTFLFTVDEKTVVDGARGGNEARFINHSCDPNCETVIEEGRILIYALRDIAPGEELTYDYNLERDGTLSRGWRRRYACTCGAATCRGTLLAPAEDPPPQRVSRGARRRRS